MLGLFVFAVSIIIAFSGQDNTADLQQIAVRLENFSKTTKTVDKNIKSKNLSTINSDLRIWMTNAQLDAEKLLAQAEVKKTQYDKEMISEENAIMTDLDEKFEDARLSARLNRVYASTMATETEKLINLYNVMAKKSAAQAIRDYAKNASKNLSPIQERFEKYTDDGN